MKLCVIAGVIFEGIPGLVADSDGDVVLQAIIHAIGTLVARPLMSQMMDELCYKQGITDSQAYLEEALKCLGAQKIEHVSIMIEAREPTLLPAYEKMCQKLSALLNLESSQVGLGIISGEGLSDVACGEGIEALCLLTTRED